MKTKSRTYKDVPPAQVGNLIQLFVDSTTKHLQSAVLQEEGDGEYTVTLVWREK